MGPLCVQCPWYDHHPHTIQGSLEDGRPVTVRPFCILHSQHSSWTAELSEHWSCREMIQTINWHLGCNEASVEGFLLAELTLSCHSCITSCFPRWEGSEMSMTKIHLVPRAEKTKRPHAPRSVPGAHKDTNTWHIFLEVSVNCRVWTHQHWINGNMGQDMPGFRELPLPHFQGCSFTLLPTGPLGNWVEKRWIPRYTS